MMPRRTRETTPSSPPRPRRRVRVRRKILGSLEGASQVAREVQRRTCLADSFRSLPGGHILFLSSADPLTVRGAPLHQPPLLELNDLTLRFGGVTALSGLGMEVREGELLALIGPNGAGKTSVLNCISGLYRAQEGSVILAGRDGARHRLHSLPPHRIAAL